MAGETWNTLVAPPTDREIDAALAEVRVRAMVHDRRRHRRTRMSVAAGFLAVALASAYGGWNAAVYRGAIIDTVNDDAAATAWPGGTTMASAGPEIPSAPLAGLQTYHITAWTEINGEQHMSGESYIQAPAQIIARLNIQFVGAELDWRLHTATWAGRPTYGGWATLRRRIGLTGRHLVRYEEGVTGFSSGTGQPGRAAIFTMLRDVPGVPGLPTIRIDGPNAPLPASGLHWILGANGARYANVSGWMVSDVFTPAAHTVRLRLVGQRQGVTLHFAREARSLVTRIPGITDRIVVGMTVSNPFDPPRAPRGSVVGSCVWYRRLHSTRDYGNACQEWDDPRQPLELRLKDGRRIVAEVDPWQAGVERRNGTR